MRSQRTYLSQVSSLPRRFPEPEAQATFLALRAKLDSDHLALLGVATGSSMKLALSPALKILMVAFW